MSENNSIRDVMYKITEPEIKISNIIRKWRKTVKERDKDIGFMTVHFMITSGEFGELSKFTPDQLAYYIIKKESDLHRIRMKLNNL